MDEIFIPLTEPNFDLAVLRAVEAISRTHDMCEVEFVGLRIAVDRGHGYGDVFTYIFKVKE